MLLFIVICSKDVGLQLVYFFFFLLCYLLIDEEVDDSDDDDEEGYYVYCDVNNGICVDIFFCCVGNLVGYLI